MNEEIQKEKSQKRWLKRGGAAGFMFFLIKGLLWLTVLIPAAFAYFAC